VLAFAGISRKSTWKDKVNLTESQLERANVSQKFKEFTTLYDHLFVLVEKMLIRKNTFHCLIIVRKRVKLQIFLIASNFTLNKLESQSRSCIVVNKRNADVHNIFPLSVSIFSRIFHMILFSSNPALTIANESVSICVLVISGKVRKKFVNNCQFSTS